MRQIGSDEDLAGLIAADNLTLHKLKITHKQIIDVLNRIIDHHKYFESDDGNMRDLHKELDNFTKFKIFNGFQIVNVKKNFVLGRYRVVAIKWDKTFMCGFDLGHGIGGTTDYVIVKENDEWLHVDCLQLHQISEHHFFHGVKSFRRLDPLYIIKFFNLKSGVSYGTKFEEFDMWKLINYCDMFILLLDMNEFDSGGSVVVKSVREKSYEAKLILGGGGVEKLLVHVLDAKFCKEYIELFGARAYVDSGNEKKSGTYYFVEKVHCRRLHQDELRASEKFGCF
ncbi:MAG: hypothetical protein Hyperionvirus9_76 [Hyperionvirus sp.]|uniref:Uncharacterized protein n=1 Tax=Hyperionvirus sp. TaxID=2487770 RepID=A0A3G5AE63_9VIRU|nr:MAG: hypothetical protein Hyperionvirus9_76 [Hyperionvirus sp.]